MPWFGTLAKDLSRQRERTPVKGAVPIPHNLFQDGDVMGREGLMP